MRIMTTARSWLKRLETVVPESTTRARNMLAWYLARTGIETDEQLSTLDIKPAPALGPAAIQLAALYVRRTA